MDRKFLRSVKKLFCILVLSFTAFSIMAQSLVSELQQLYRIDLLPKYKEGTVKMFSSYDRTGNNDDGFNGTYSFLRMEGKKQVVAEMTGPGVIVRIHTPTPTHDTIEFYFDGEATPRISLSYMDLFSGNKFPFLSPICGHEIGGYYCYLPILYNKSCKVLFTGKMLFWQLEYRTFPQGVEISSYTSEWNNQEIEELDNLVDTWRRYGNNYLDGFYNNLKFREIGLNLKPGERKVLFDSKRGGRIVGIEVSGLDKIAREDNRLILKAKWDNENDWSINSPAKDFFGFYFGEKSMKSLLAGSDAARSYCYYPMPYRKSALIEVELSQNSSIPDPVSGLLFRIFYTDVPQQTDEGRFNAYWRRDSLTGEGVPYVIMPKILGKGHFTGTVLVCQGKDPGSTGYFEGDDIVTSDGEMTLHGTGSEDFFNGGYYDLPDRWDFPYSLPAHGCLGYSNPLGRTGAFRYFLSDKLSFNRDFELTIEHGPTGNRIPVDYRSVSFYYCDKVLPQKTPGAKEIEYPIVNNAVYDALHFKILSIRNGRIISGESVGNKRILILESSGSQSPMQVQLLLSASSDGSYKLYCSYFRDSSSGDVKFNQRQNILMDFRNLYADREEYTEREYVGKVNIIDNQCTVTISLRGKESSRFLLHKILLEKE